MRPTAPSRISFGRQNVASGKIRDLTPAWRTVMALSDGQHYAALAGFYIARGSDDPNPWWLSEATYNLEQAILRLQRAKDLLPDSSTVDP